MTKLVVLFCIATSACRSTPQAINTPALAVLERVAQVSTIFKAQLAEHYAKLQECPHYGFLSFASKSQNTIAFVWVCGYTPWQAVGDKLLFSPTQTKELQRTFELMLARTNVKDAIFHLTLKGPVGPYHWVVSIVAQGAFLLDLGMGGTPEEDVFLTIRSAFEQWQPGPQTTSATAI